MALIDGWGMDERQLRELHYIFCNPVVNALYNLLDNYKDDITPIAKEEIRGIIASMNPEEFFGD